MEGSKECAVIIFTRNPTETLPAFFVRRWKVQSFSDKNKSYTVGLDKKGQFRCSCPVGIFRPFVTCKHVMFIQRMLAGIEELETK